MLIVSYQEWLSDALCNKVVSDEIVNANHMIHYLKYHQENIDFAYAD
jgi:hypothetical protein